MKFSLKKKKEKQEEKTPSQPEVRPPPEPKKSPEMAVNKPSPGVQQESVEAAAKLQQAQELAAKQAMEREPSIQQGQQITHTEKVHMLIKLVSSTDDKTISPVINFEKNRIGYPILTKIGEDQFNVEFLEKLALKATGVLEKEVYERVLVCPQHSEDLSVSTRLYCPECNSMHIERLHLIEHKVCGYIAPIEEFGVTTVNDVTACPNCKKKVKDLKKEIRMPGRWYRCHDCERKFDDAVIKLFCRRFNHDFSIHEAETYPISYFKIRQRAGESVDKLTLVPQLKKILTSLGYTVQEFPVVKGKSGMGHEVSIHAQNNENKTVVVIIRSAKEAIADAEVNSILVNALDISATRTVVIAIPSVSERAKAMASTHGVTIVTGQNLNEIISTVENMLSKVSVSTTPTSVPTPDTSVHTTKTSTLTDGPRKIE